MYDHMGGSTRLVNMLLGVRLPPSSQVSSLTPGSIPNQTTPAGNVDAGSQKHGYRYQESMAMGLETLLTARGMGKNLRSWLAWSVQRLYCQTCEGVPEESDNGMKYMSQGILTTKVMSSGGNDMSAYTVPRICAPWAQMFTD